METEKKYMVYSDEGDFFIVNNIDKLISYLKEENALDDFYLMNKSTNDVSEAMIEMERNGVIEITGGSIEAHIEGVEAVNNTLDLISEIIGRTKVHELDRLIHEAREKRAESKVRDN
jgi:hypothetical protein